MPAYDDRARESIERGDLLGSVDAQPGRVNEYGVCGSKNLSRQENSHFSLFGRTCNDPRDPGWKTFGASPYEAFGDKP